LSGEVVGLSLDTSEEDDGWTMEGRDDRPVRLNLLVWSISHAIIFFSHNKIALIRKKKTIGQVARKSYELRRTKEPNA